MWSNSRSEFPLISSFDESKMSKLVDYIVKDHPNLSQKKIAFKFPNVSADLLSVSNDKVFDFFAKKGENESLPHLDKLTDCLDSAKHQK